MTANHDHSSAAPDDEFVRLLEVFAAAFNSGDVEALDRLYEDQGVFLPVPGRPAAGPDRTAALRYLVDRGVPMEARVRRSYVAGDIALLLVDWSLRGTARDGTPVDMSGTATDVVRRTPEGDWRYVIDNPFGSIDPPR